HTRFSRDWSSDVCSSDLISDLLDVARLSGGAIELVVEPVDPAQVVETAVSDVQPAVQQQGLTVVVDLADDLAPILADRHRVIQKIGRASWRERGSLCVVR